MAGVKQTKKQPLTVIPEKTILAAFWAAVSKFIKIVVGAS
jgi:hypothetical protein